MPKKKAAPKISGSIVEMLELHELTVTRNAIEDGLLNRKVSTVIHNGRTYNYDDALTVLVNWCKAAKKCNVKYKNTQNFLNKYESAHLERLGLQLD